MSDRATVGWREWIGLPDLGVAHVKAKVDTGAKTSAVHAWDVVVDDDVVHFSLHPVQEDDTVAVAARAPLVGEREVKSSNGELELRPVIRTALRLGESTTEIELTLTRRDEMGFRMLLGREALRTAGCVVDPARSFVLGGNRHRPPPVG